MNYVTVHCPIPYLTGYKKCCDDYNIKEPIVYIAFVSNENHLVVYQPCGYTLSEAIDYLKTKEYYDQRLSNNNVKQLKIKFSFN